MNLGLIARKTAAYAEIGTSAAYVESKFTLIFYGDRLAEIR